MKKYTYICGVASKEDAFIFYIEDGVLLSALINLRKFLHLRIISNLSSRPCHI